MKVKESYLKDSVCREKNQNVSEIMEFVISSSERVWWKCEKGHIWQCTVNNRAKHGCPFCAGRKAVAGENDIFTLYPKLKKEWDFEKNKNIKPDEILPASGKKIWWRCEKGHPWQAVVYSRTKQGTGCPYCSGKRSIPGENDFMTLYPGIAKEWDFERNKDINPSLIGSCSHKKAWWKCDKGHSYQCVVAKRTQRGDGCPYCSGRYAIVGETDLATLRQDLLVDWDYEKNELLPSDYTVCSKKSVYWRCENGHSYKRKIVERTRQGLGCSYCSGRWPIIGETDLKTLNPVLAQEWNYEKNVGKDPTDYKKFSNEKVWWKCERGHEWKASITNRAQGKGCPFCAKEGW